MLTPRAVATDATGRYLLPVERDSELVASAAAAGHLPGWGETRVSATALGGRSTSTWARARSSKAS